MKKLITITLLVAAMVAGGIYHEEIYRFVSGEGFTSESDASSTPAIEVVSAPPTRVRLACIDPTTSTESGFSSETKSSLIAAVEQYLPPKPTVTKNGVDPVAGLDLSVRLVATAPLEYGAPFYRVQVPGIPGLPARVDMSEPGAMSPGGAYDQWKDAEAEWSRAYDEALAAVQVGVATLQAVDLSIRQWSGITACMSALAAIAPPDGDVSFALFSDLEETVPSQTTGTFAGHDILVVQPTGGNAARADSLFNSFASWATAQGAGNISHIRPEVAHPAIESFVKESN